MSLVHLYFMQESQVTRSGQEQCPKQTSTLSEVALAQISLHMAREQTEYSTPSQKVARSEKQSSKRQVGQRYSILSPKLAEEINLFSFE